MRSSIGNVMDIFRSKKPNTFWKGDRLVGEASLHWEIETLSSLYKDESDLPVIRGVYLFGSLARLKGKEYYRTEPSDLDLFVWITNLSKEEEIKKAFSEIHISFNKPIDVTTRIYHPSLHLNFADIDLYPIHTLYEHPRLSYSTLDKICREEIIGDDVLELI